MPSRIASRRLVRQRLPRRVATTPGRSHPLLKTLRRIFLSVLIVVIVLAGSAGLWFWRQVAALPKDDANIVFVPSKLDENQGQIILAHLSADSNHILYATFPLSWPANIFGGYGSYPLRSVYPLLKLDKKSPEFLKAAFTHALQIPIAAVVVADQPLAGDAPGVRGLWWQLVQGHVQSAVGLAQRWQWSAWGRAVGVEQMKMKTVTGADDWQKLVAQFHNQMPPAACAVAIFNTTTVTGAASELAHILGNSTVPVVRLTDTNTPSAQTHILVSAADQCPAVVSQVQQLFPFVVQPEVNAQTLTQYRANVVVLVGQDFAQEWGKGL